MTKKLEVKPVKLKTIQCDYCEMMFTNTKGLNSHRGKIHGKATTPFKPSPKMIELLRAKLDIEVKPTITAECEKIGIDRSTYYNWFEDVRFVEWFNKEWEEGMAKMIPYLDKVGLQKALQDFRYYELLQMKFGNYKRAEKSDTSLEIKVTTNRGND